MSGEEAVYARLAALGISYERHEHPPVPTVEAAAQYWTGIDATHCKNLFLRNQKGNRHYLVVLLHSKRADLRALADQIGDGKLSFASPERLMTHLGLTPGSVSPFGLINDRGRAVRVVLDRDLKRAARVSFHPNLNTRTLVLAWADVERFLAASGNPLQFVTIEGSDTEGSDTGPTRVRPVSDPGPTPVRHRSDPGPTPVRPVSDPE